jgi:hypothetical protein
MSGFDRKLEFWGTLAKAAVAGKHAKAAPVAPAARERKPIRHAFEPNEIVIPPISDFVDPETLLASKTAAAVIAAGDLARSGGRPLSAPEGLAAAIIAAGEKRRTPRGG